MSIDFDIMVVRTNIPKIYFGWNILFLASNDIEMNDVKRIDRVGMISQHSKPTFDIEQRVALPDFAYSTFQFKRIEFVHVMSRSNSVET